MNLYKVLSIRIYIAILCYMINIGATQHVSHLLVKAPLKTRLQKREQIADKYINNKEIVFIKTKDKKIFPLDRWQLEYMPYLFTMASQQKKNSFGNPLDISQITINDSQQPNGIKIIDGINSEELELLSTTWNEMKGFGVLFFLDDLKKDNPHSLSVLQDASKKIGNNLLYATTTSYLMPPEMQSKIAEPLITPIIKLLKQQGYVSTTRPIIFNGPQRNPFFDAVVSTDGKKWVDKSLNEGKLLNWENQQLSLYYIPTNQAEITPGKVNNPASQILGLQTELIKKRFIFSPDSKMLAAIPKYTKGNLLCWDIYDKIKKYTINYEGFVDEIAFSPDCRTIVFIGSNEPPSAENKRADKLYICHLTQENPKPQLIETITKPIQSIIFSPDNKNFACISEREVNIYYSNPKGYFTAKAIQWDDEKPPITSITFDATGNKFICHVKNPEIGQLTTLLYIYKLYDNNFILYRTTEVDGKFFGDIRFDLKENSCLITQSSTTTGLDKGIYYWDNIDQKNSKPRLVYNGDSPTQAALSPNSQLCVFASNPDITCEKLYYFYTSNCIVREIEKSLFFNTRSLTFSKDSKHCSVIRQKNDIPDNKTTISKKNLKFGDQELRNCNLGTATLLHNVLEELLKHHHSQIVKKTLAYELLYRLPLQLREFIIKILKLDVVDYLDPRRRLTESKENEQEFPQSELQEPPHDIAKILTKKASESLLQDLAQYLEQIKQQPTIKHEMKMPSSNPPETLAGKIITSLSTMGNYIYSYLPSRLQRLFKKENPIAEKEPLNPLQENQ